MNISIIAAVGKNNELGKNNDLIWHFKEDLAYFKQTTLGATVIMGRKTFESLPGVLPERKNIVISSNNSFNPKGAYKVDSISQALELAKNEKVFIIGGASIYKAFLDYADKIYLTEIDDVCEEADTFFPDFDKSKYKKEIINSLTVNSTKLDFCLYSKI